MGRVFRGTLIEPCSSLVRYISSKQIFAIPHMYLYQVRAPPWSVVSTSTHPLTDHSHRSMNQWREMCASSQRPNFRPIVRAISFVNNHRGRKFSVRPVVRPTTVYDLS